MFDTVTIFWACGLPRLARIVPLVEPPNATVKSLTVLCVIEVGAITTPDVSIICTIGYAPKLWVTFTEV